MAMASRHLLHAVCTGHTSAVRSYVSSALQGLASIDFLDHPTPRSSTEFESVTLRQGHTETPVAIVSFDGFNTIDGLLSALQSSQFNRAVALDRPADLRKAVQRIASDCETSFGLERFRDSADALVMQRTLSGRMTRTAVVSEVVSFCQLRGISRLNQSRIQSVADELLMNAQFDAPRGSEPRVTEPVRVEWMWDSNRLWIAVTDYFGRLQKDQVIAAISRARASSGVPVNSDASTTAPGAGVGLFFVTSHVAEFFVHVQPDHRTEVIAMFELPGREQSDSVGVRSMHFVTSSAA
jgi:anti-sigma regulatory factor (Ser/Thr protein kinase)